MTYNDTHDTHIQHDTHIIKSIGYKMTTSFAAGGNPQRHVGSERNYW